MSSTLSSNRDLRLRGPFLLPGDLDRFSLLFDGALITDTQGRIEYLGEWAGAPVQGGFERVGLLIPPLVDCHIHIPQNPIRGRFIEGVRGDEPEGPLLAGLARNVFPAEGKCVDLEYASEVTKRFLEDTRSSGTLGGVAYMTSHPVAARAALQILPASWKVGLVLMDQNCPVSLQISPGEAAAAMDGLARDFGQRLVVTDRFAVACSSRLRKAGVEAARKWNLRTQTHLAEQPGELATIRRLYPDAPHYTGVYEADGLLGGEGSILAHCIHMSEPEWEILARRKSVAAHCPVSNTELGSGVMNLRKVYEYGIDYAICTDVGASPSVSLLVEASHFVGLHQGKMGQKWATPEAALWRVTEGAKRLAGIGLELGGLERGKAFSGLELKTVTDLTVQSPGDIIRGHVLGTGSIQELQHQLEGKVMRIWGM